jgi:hypothetical protein
MTAVFALNAMLEHENLLRLQQKEKNVVKPHGGPSQRRFGGQGPEGLTL